MPPDKPRAGRAYARPSNMTPIRAINDTTSVPNMLTAALELISHGWDVFPCVPGGKAPLARCVPNGYLGATRDPEQARRWWTRFPSANIAIPTGIATVDVLDVDNKPAGAGFSAVERLLGAGVVSAPATFVTTPSGGLHCYYRGTNQRSGALPKHFIDFKASGGYVLVPPSVVNGTSYEYVTRHTPQEVLVWEDAKELLDPPLAKRWVTCGSSGTGVSRLSHHLARQPEGNRNRFLYWAANRALENGASEYDLEDLIAAALTAGLTEREARQVVRSALRTTRRSA
ncbi:bifunctional DNA primase/polymerase [Nonomuraea candida]|uniref:bifunctional DNA primase/polymerase n=1 Tax=Nonomuraea candida TaxID=359159 RepID=UPI0006933E9A|nr:bifunctional DNA primase/polymerase [Nonomuraea candida]